jgi:adenylate cyclase
VRGEDVRPFRPIAWASRAPLQLPQNRTAPTIEDAKRENRTLGREQRKLAAIVAADVVGYSRLIGRDESGTLAALKAVREEVVDPAIAAHHGRIVKTMGDGLLLEFGSVVDAVRCAIEMQTGVAARGGSVPEDRRIVYRIGINLGDVVVDGDDIFGDGVNVAARLEAIAEPGGICLSDDAARQVQNRIDASFESLGAQTLKNIAQPVLAWRWGGSPSSRAAPDAPSPLPPDKPSIAVRPFAVLSPDSRLEFVADGLAEDVIALLARVPGFFVISRSSSLAFRDPALPSTVMSKQLGVRYVVEGSVRSIADKVRVSAQLAEAESGHVLWTGRFDTAPSDAFELQDDIARAIMVELEPALTRAQVAVIKRRRAENADAWGLYHQASAALGGKGWNEEALREAMGFLQKSLELDDSFALARAQLALLWGLASTTGVLRVSEEQRAQAMDLAEQAISADAGSSEVLGYAGCALTDLGRPERGGEILRQAVEIDPSNAQAEVALGAAIAMRGDLEGGIEHLRRGIRLSPRDRRLGFWGWALGSFLLRANRPEEALAEARLSARRDPRLHLPLIVEALALAITGDFDGARVALGSARRLHRQLSLEEIEASHGRRAARALATLWPQAEGPI